MALGSRGSPLRVALPGYDVIITSHSPRYRFEAIRRRDETGPWCVISTDPGDLWRELVPSKNIAALVNLNTVPTGADTVQLERVANLMAEGGMLARPTGNWPRRSWPSIRAPGRWHGRTAGSWFAP